MADIQRTTFEAREPFCDQLCAKDAKFKLVYHTFWGVAWLIAIFQGVRYYQDANILAEDTDYWLWAFKGMLTCTFISISTNLILLAIFYFSLKNWFYAKSKRWIIIATQTLILMLCMLAVDVATFHYLDIGVCAKFFMKLENVRIFMKMVSLITNLKQRPN